MTGFVNFYQLHFVDGTCHELPTTDDVESADWVKWRAEHPGQWLWRPRAVDADGCLSRDANGRYVPPGPWLNPDGTKQREYDARKVAVAFDAFQKAVKKFFPKMDPVTLAQTKALVAAWERKL